MFFKKKTETQQCPICTQTLMENFEVPVVKFMGTTTIQEFVCSTACKREYDEKLLRSGM